MTGFFNVTPSQELLRRACRGSLCGSHARHTGSSGLAVCHGTRRVALHNTSRALIRCGWHHSPVMGLWIPDDVFIQELRVSSHSCQIQHTRVFF